MRNAIIALFSVFCIITAVSAEKFDEQRALMFVDANIKAVHAFQVQDQRLGDKFNEKFWPKGGVSKEELKSLVALQKEMLSVSPDVIRAWLRGENSAFEADKYLKPILDSKLPVLAEGLPVNVWIKWLSAKAPQAPAYGVKSVANLSQVLVEVNRDGDILQDLFRVYSSLGLPVWFGQLGITGETDEEFLKYGSEISANMTRTSYAVGEEDVQMHFRKMYNWGRRYTGIRDKFTLGSELAQKESIKTAISLVEKQAGRKIAVIGHSFSMEAHWSTPSSFIPVVTELVKKHNPKTEFKYFQQGGMDAVTAEKKFLGEALAWKPDLVVFVIITGGESNRKALSGMIKAFNKSGAKCCIFDCMWPADFDLDPKNTDPLLKGLNLDIIEVKKLLEASPMKEKFLCLDRIHMTEPWHMLMAEEWFKYLAGARSAGL